NLCTDYCVQARIPFHESVSGTALPPQSSQQEQGNDKHPAVNSRLTATVQDLPNRLDSLRWIIIGGFAALFALGVLLLWRQPALATAAGAGGLPVPTTPPQGPRKRKAAPPVAPAAVKAAAVTFASTRPAAPSVQPDRAASAVSVSSGADVSSVESPDLDREVQKPGSPTHAARARSATLEESSRAGVGNSLDSLK